MKHLKVRGLCTAIFEQFPLDFKAGRLNVQTYISYIHATLLKLLLGLKTESTRNTSFLLRSIMETKEFI